MPDWTKFYEAITKPLPVTSSLFLFIVSLFLLEASASTLDKIGMTAFVASYRWVVGLGFIIAAGWLIVTALIGIVKWCHQKGAAYVARKKQQRRLHALAADERQILEAYVNTENRTLTFNASGDIAVAQGLTEEGILYRPDVPVRDVMVVAYSIHEWALAYLSKNKALIAATVSSEKRWQS